MRHTATGPSSCVTHGTSFILSLSRMSRERHRPSVIVPLVAETFDMILEQHQYSSGIDKL